jgi:hypothetical protein
MITDQQVRRLMTMIEKGVPLATAAAKAAMSEPTARKWRRLGKRPSEVKGEPPWRTRSDPFADVWPEVVVLLEREAGLEAKTVFEELQRRYPQRFQAGQLRTLQRRFWDWRALNGPAQEVFFPQGHCPGEQCQSDFTDMRALGVTIGGEPYPPLLYHFVLTYSNWEWVTVCFSETFEALSEGLQGALWQLGAVPAEHRTDNLSAVTRELRLSRGRGFTVRYPELLDHDGLKASKNNPGRAHENGDVESAHGGLKGRVDQRLRLRGSRAFASLDAYRAFLDELLAERNAAHTERLAEERAVMRPLPARALDPCRELMVSVTRASTLRVVGKTYSVPSRRRGHRVRVRLSATEVEVSYQGSVVERFPRLQGPGAARIDYRHIIHSLVRKPGAFRRYAFREALFPSLTFRRAYDVLVERSESWADLEYVRILYLAATTWESRGESALAGLLEAGAVPTYEAVKARVLPTPHLSCPEMQVALPDLKVYDTLLRAEVAKQGGTP